MKMLRAGRLRLSNEDAVSYSGAAMTERAERCRPRERGQAMSEYVILLFGCMLGLLAILTPMRNAIHTYTKSIYFCVSLPYP